MEVIKDYRHTEAREGLCKSKELLCSVHIDHAPLSLINANEDFIGRCKPVPRRESTSDITI